MRVSGITATRSGRSIRWKCWWQRACWGWRRASWERLPPGKSTLNRMELTGPALDVDATDDPLHGRQEGRFFHGYYRSYCYLPLYIFCGQQLLGARLRTADRDAADGTVEELERIVGRIRKRWPGVEIWLRGDSGFCRDELLAWCEAQGVEYVLGNRAEPALRGDVAGACRARGWRGRNAARSA